MTRVAWAHDAGEFLDVEMDQIAWMFALVAAHRWRRFQSGETVRMTAQQAGHRSLGESGRLGDLEARQLAATQRQDACDAQRVDGSGGTLGTRRTILEARSALGAEARQPLVGATLREAESRRHLRDGLLESDDAVDHLGSTHRGQLGFTVRVHAAVVLGSVLISQPHLPKSSPHEQPIGTSHLARAAMSARKPNPRLRASLSLRSEAREQPNTKPAWWNGAQSMTDGGRCGSGVLCAWWWVRAGKVEASEL